MTKKQLINNLRVREGMTLEQASRIVHNIFEDIAVEVVAGKDVYIPKFGRFFTTTVAKKRCKHPKTKEDVIIPAHGIVRFRMASDLKRRLNA